MSAAEKIEQNKRDLEVELVAILHGFTLPEEVTFDRTEENEEEQPVQGRKVEAGLMSLGNGTQASVVGVE